MKSFLGDKKKKFQKGWLQSLINKTNKEILTSFCSMGVFGCRGPPHKETDTNAVD